MEWECNLISNRTKFKNAREIKHSGVFFCSQKVMNTGDRMVMNVYLGHVDAALISLANRRGRLKVVKWFYLLNCFGIGLENRWT